MSVLLHNIEVKPGALDAVEARFAQTIKDSTYRSRLLGAWRSEIGMLNQAVHLWSSKSDSIPTWLTGIEEYIVTETHRTLTPAPFSPLEISVRPDFVYEIRIYRYRHSGIPDVIERWSKRIAARNRLSPLLICGYTEGGSVSDWVHLWGYKNLLERQQIRAQAISSGIWPPGAFSGLVSQQNMILVAPKLSPFV